MSGAPLDDQTLAIAGGVCIYTAAAAPKFFAQKSIYAVHALAELIAVNPNATIEEVGETLGASVKMVNDLLGPFEGWDTLVQLVPMVDQAAPFLPHHKAPSNFLPIFLALTIFTGLIMIMRMYSRFTIMGGIQSYDWVAVLAYLMSIGYGISVLPHIGIWGAIDYWDLSWNEFSAKFASAYAAFLYYPIIIAVIKTSILLFYYKLTVWRPMRIAAISVFVFVWISTVAIVFATAFQCKPVLYWTDYINATCPEKYQQNVAIAAGVLIIFTDCLIWIMPLPMVWKLQLSNRERLMAVLTFGLGIFVCVASGLRLEAVQKSWAMSAGEAKPSIIHIWAIVELFLALVCASLPALRALVMSYMKTGKSMTGGTSEMSGSMSKEKSNSKNSNAVVSHVEVNSQKSSDDASGRHVARQLHDAEA